MKKKFKELRRTPPPDADISISIDDKDRITDAQDLSGDSPMTMKRHVSTHKKWYERPYSKKQKVIALIIAGVIILLGAGTFTYFHYFHKNNQDKVSVTIVKKPKVVVITSPLSGLPVTAAQAKLPVTAVMIENSDQARPQSGLSQAGVVFEALAEGGITRLWHYSKRALLAQSGRLEVLVHILLTGCYRLTPPMLTSEVVPLH